jgi:hypothetical protein
MFNQGIDKKMFVNNDLCELDLLNSDIEPEDLERDYYNSLFLIQIDNNLLPFVLLSYSRGIVVGQALQDYLWRSVEFKVPQYSLYYLNPSTGFYNVFFCTVYIKRLSTRQYKCGYNERTYNADWGGNLAGLQYIIRALPATKFDRNYNLLKQTELLTELKEPKYLNNDDAIASIFDGNKLQAAVSPFFAYSVGPSANNINLLYHNLFVGKYIKKQKLVILDTLIAEDIIDVAENNGIKCEIK